MKATVLDSAFRTPAQNAASGMGRLATRWGVMGIIFVTAVDVADWYAQPANERAFTDLLVDLGLNLGTTVISAVAGAVVAEFVLSVMSLSAPVVIFVVAGLLVGVAIGGAVNATGLRERMKSALRNT